MNMNKSEDGHDARNIGGLSEDLSTGHCTRVTLRVADMFKNLGSLLDKGLEDDFRDR